MKTRFFENVNNLSELKKAYRAAAFANHPDRGGDAKTMADINADYDELFSRLKAKERNDEARQQAEKTGEQAETINPDDIDGDDGYKIIIELLLHLDENINIELCGGWLWISGATREIKDQLKAAGCYWAPKKKMWYWRPADYKCHGNRKAHSMNYIRSKYGSTAVNKDSEKKQLSA